MHIRARIAVAIGCVGSIVGVRGLKAEERAGEVLQFNQATGLVSRSLFCGVVVTGGGSVESTIPAYDDCGLGASGESRNEKKY